MRMAKPEHLEPISATEINYADFPGLRVYEKTMNLRFVRRYEATTEVRVLQQAWVCRETGEFDWRDVELVEDV